MGAIIAIATPIPQRCKDVNPFLLPLIVMTWRDHQHRRCEYEHYEIMMMVMPQQSPHSTSLVCNGGISGIASAVE